MTKRRMLLAQVRRLVSDAGVHKRFMTDTSHPMLSNFCDSGSALGSLPVVLVSALVVGMVVFAVIQRFRSVHPNSAPPCWVASRLRATLSLLHLAQIE
jgi:hypothetical protein